jgi:hypothetical protein
MSEERYGDCENNDDFFGYNYSEDFSQDFSYANPTIGFCCFCHMECNPNSQACGNCFHEGRAYMSEISYEKSEIVSEKKIEKIPLHFENYVLQIKKEDRTCPICLETIEKDIYLSKCYHLYHLSCIEESMKHTKKCPTCQKKL